MGSDRYRVVPDAHAASDKENIPPGVPNTPHGRKRAARGDAPASPKRALRTYTTHARRGIPFAPVGNRARGADLAEHMAGLHLRPAVPAGARSSPPPPAPGAGAPRAPRRSLLRLPSVVTARRLRLPSRSAASASRGPRAAAAAALVRGHDAHALPLADAKQLRVALAAESDAWVHEFVAGGGYDALLARTNELVALEWRGEREDMLLHEILRCLAGVATSPSGTDALQRSAPAPFQVLATLLFSAKRPADTATRTLIVQLLLVLTDMDLPDTLLDTLVHGVAPASSPVLPVARAHCTHPGALFALLLLHVPPREEDAAKVPFLQALHMRPPLRPYVAELQTVCNEFFWIFCHADSPLPDWATLDVRAATAPRVPCGMTGSVEYEAMAYMTANMKLLNAIAERLLFAKDAAPACALYDALDAARMRAVVEVRRSLRVCLPETLCKASQEYYMPLHVELARFRALQQSARAGRREGCGGGDDGCALASPHSRASSEQGRARRPSSTARRDEDQPRLDILGDVDIRHIAF
ncbi:hypothetical protein MSPP1_004172 [Malassezia sp. CBS 17886]|nr:hypothetical protein MSPP1_004172 [Malassezia sp. CBS 17886]